MKSSSLFLHRFIEAFPSMRFSFAQFGQDSGLIGDYSTTVFISNPSEYEGGELSLYIDGEEKLFKLESGMAVTYNTGIPHQVKTVFSGQRIVCVFWTHSRFRDPMIRKIYSDTLEIGDIFLEQSGGLEDNTNFEVYVKDPRYILNNIQNNLIRKFSTFNI
jgi:predicted 2-oxoglutarate/Fe(II)-dependent dioxygenase YbiX